MTDSQTQRSDGKKTYFISFDYYEYYDGSPDRYFTGLVDINLKSEKLITVCHKLITELDPKCNTETITVKIIALNNIEV